METGREVTLGERIKLVRELVPKRTQEEFAKILGLSRGSAGNWARASQPGVLPLGRLFHFFKTLFGIFQLFFQVCDVIFKHRFDAQRVKHPGPARRRRAPSAAPCQDELVWSCRTYRFSPLSVRSRSKPIEPSSSVAAMASKAAAVMAMRIIGGHVMARPR